VASAAEPRALAEGRLSFRVRYPETDRMGVAYHAHYLVWFGLGRTELMRELGCDYGGLERQHGLFFPLVELGARYLAPARYDDVLEVATRLTAVRGARLRFDYRLHRTGGATLLARGFTEHAAVGRDGRATRIPSWLRGRLRAERDRP
jgi:acyl-CoA thioester hydrolase